MQVRVGTSGWSYPSGAGTWNGVFYPSRRGRQGGTEFDELRFYAEHFDTVEVNSTFYRPPSAAVTRTWVERTPAGFEFSVKLYQKFTHPGMFRDTALRSVRPAALGAAAGGGRLLDALAAVTDADIDEFKAGIEPLARAGKLGVLLAQFPASFRSGPAATDCLARLLRAFSGYSVAVELRHASWSDALADTLSLLGAFGAAWVQIDEPKFRFSIRQNLLPNLDTFYYLRLHGRNAAHWWRHAKSEDRYNYLYSSDELREFSDAAGAAAQIVKKAYAYTNNHFSAKSVVNAVMLKAQLGQSIEGAYPQAIVDRYPDLRGLVTLARGRAATGVRLFS